MKSLNNLKQSLTILSSSKAAFIKGGTNSTPPPPAPNDTADSVGGPWDNRGKRPGSKG